MVKLQGLTFEVKYIEWENNVMADLMSRPFKAEKATLEEVHTELHATALRTEEQNVTNNKLINAIELISLFDTIAGDQTSEILLEYKIPEERIIEIDHVYYYNDFDRPKIIVPPTHTNFIIEEIHKFGHYGPSKLIPMLRQFYVWPV